MALIAIKETTIVTIVNHIIVHCQINRVIIAKISWWNCLTFDLYACISSVYERSVGIAALKKTRFAAGKIKASKKKNDLERIDVEQNDINSFFHLKEKIPFLRMNRIQLWSDSINDVRRNVSWGARETCSLILPEWNIHGRVHARRYATKPLCRVSAEWHWSRVDRRVDNFMVYLTC